MAKRKAILIKFILPSLGILGGSKSIKKELLICEYQIIIENRRKFAKTIFFIINLVLLNIKKIEKIITNNICLSISN
jgi:hypothetical protein